MLYFALESFGRLAIGGGRVSSTPVSRNAADTRVFDSSAPLLNISSIFFFGRCSSLVALRVWRADLNYSAYWDNTLLAVVMTLQFGQRCFSCGDVGGLYSLSAFMLCIVALPTAFNTLRLPWISEQVSSSLRAFDLPIVPINSFIFGTQAVPPVALSWWHAAF